MARLTATALAQNRDVVDLFRRLGDVDVRLEGGGTLDLAVELTDRPVELEFDVSGPEGVGAGLRHALGAAATGDLRPPGWRWLEESAPALRRRLP